MLFPGVSCGRALPDPAGPRRICRLWPVLRWLREVPCGGLGQLVAERSAVEEIKRQTVEGSSRSGRSAQAVLRSFPVFSQVLNHVESAMKAGPMACADSAFAMAAPGTGNPISTNRRATSRMTAGNRVSGLVSGKVSAVQASSSKTGRTHQDGETVTRMVITNLVRPETTRKTAEITEKTHLFAPGAVGSSWRLPDRPLGPSHTPIATVVRSRSGTSMPAPAGGFSFVRFVRRSSTNPNPLAAR